MRAVLVVLWLSAAVAVSSDPVPGDSCTDAVSITVPGTFDFDTTNAAVNASDDAAAWSCSTLVGHDLYFRTQSIEAGSVVVFSTCTPLATPFDTVLALLDHDCAEEFACVDDSCQLKSRIQTVATGGPLVVRIGGYYGSSGAATLRVDVTPPVKIYADRFEPASVAVQEFWDLAFVNMDEAEHSIVVNGGSVMFTVQPGSTVLAPIASNLYQNTFDFYADSPEIGFYGSLAIGALRVAISDTGVEPASGSVVPGSYVVFWNVDAASAHSAALDDGTMETGSLEPFATSMSMYFSNAGDYLYTTDQGFAGNVTVIDCGGCHTFGADCGEVTDLCGVTIFCGGCYYSGDCCNSVTHQCGACHDECSDPQDVAAPGVVELDTSRASDSTMLAAPSCSTNFGKDLFYRTPVILSGFGLSVSTCGGAEWDTAIALYDDDTCGNEVACSEDDCVGAYQSRIEHMGGGGQITIRLGGYEYESGSAVMRLDVFRNVIVSDTGFEPSVVLMVKGQHVRFVSTTDASHAAVGTVDEATVFEVSIDSHSTSVLELSTENNFGLPTGFGVVPFRDPGVETGFTGELVITGAVINLFQFGLQPGYTRVLIGLPVAFYNFPLPGHDGNVSVASDDGETFSSPTMAPGEYFLHTFTSSGSFGWRTSTGFDGSVEVTDPCSSAYCEQTCMPFYDGSYECQCEDGYYNYEDDPYCYDIDECYGGDCGESGCGATKRSVPVAGSSAGRGKSGLARSVNATFALARQRHGRQAGEPGYHPPTDDDVPYGGGCDMERGYCSNSQPGWTCYCYGGYELDAAGFDCSDINECATDNGGCAEGETCFNQESTYRCAPVHAICADALNVTAPASFVTVTGRGLPHDRLGCGAAADANNHNVFYSVEPIPVGNLVTITACGPHYYSHPAVVVYDETCDGAVIRCVASACGTPVQFLSTGRRFVVRVASYSSEYNVDVTISYEARSVGNDECIGAAPINQIGYSIVTVDNRLATTSPHPNPTNASRCGPIVNDVWFKLNALVLVSRPETIVGLCSNYLYGSNNFDSVIEVYDGCSGNLITCNNDFSDGSCCSWGGSCDNRFSKVAFPTSESIYIRIGASGWAPETSESYSNTIGTMSVDVFQPDNCVYRPCGEKTCGVWPADNCGSTQTCGDCGPDTDCLRNGTLCDHNECATDNGGCRCEFSWYGCSGCQNTIGGRQCTCSPGYYLAADGITCRDVNECETNNGGCDPGACYNQYGGYYCECPAPRYIQRTYTEQNKTCHDAADDECVNATRVGFNGTYAFHTTGYTTSAPAACANFYHDQWLVTNPVPVGHTVTINWARYQSSSYDIAVAVYDAVAGCGSLPLRCSNGAYAPSAGQLTVQSTGRALIIRVGSLYTYSYGPGTLSVTTTASPPLANDECAGAMELTLSTAETSYFNFDNLLATDSAGGDVCGWPVINDLWYRFDPAIAVGKPVIVSVCNLPTTFDSVLAVYASCGGEQLACNGDFCGTRSQVEFLATGSPVYVRIGASALRSPTAGNYPIVGSGGFTVRKLASCSTYTSCESLGKVCGQWPDGCGNTQSCGECGGPGFTCFDNGTACDVDACYEENGGCLCDHDAGGRRNANCASTCVAQRGSARTCTCTAGNSLRSGTDNVCINTDECAAGTHRCGAAPNYCTDGGVWSSYYEGYRCYCYAPFVVRNQNSLTAECWLPPADECAVAMDVNITLPQLLLQETVTSVSFDNSLHSTSPNQPACHQFNYDMWFRTPPIPDGYQVTITACTTQSFYSWAAVYQGNCTGTPIRCQRTCSYSPALSFMGNGQPLYIRYGTEYYPPYGAGPGTLTITLKALFAQWDECSSAALVPLPLPASVTYDTAIASDSNTSSCWPMRSDLWFRLNGTAVAAGRKVVVSTCSADGGAASGVFDSVLGVFSSCGGTQLVCNNNYNNNKCSRVAFAATGEDVFIRLGGNANLTSPSLPQYIGSGTLSVRSNAACSTFTNCSALGKVCGMWPDGCGEQQVCGECGGSGYLCRENGTLCDVDSCYANGGKGPCTSPSGSYYVTCTDYIGNFTCTCTLSDGFAVTPDGLSCVDINECATNNGGCLTGSCSNYAGGYSCTCPDPLTKLTIDGKDSCIHEVGDDMCPGATPIVLNQQGDVYTAVFGFNTTGHYTSPLYQGTQASVSCGYIYSDQWFITPVLPAQHDVEITSCQSFVSTVTGTNLFYNGTSNLVNYISVFEAHSSGNCQTMQLRVCQAGNCGTGAYARFVSSGLRLIIRVGAYYSWQQPLGRIGLRIAPRHDCQNNNGGCTATQQCNEFANGAFLSCTCLPGYTVAGATCVDINECATNNGNCGTATCRNLPGSFHCDLTTGTTGSTGTTSTGTTSTGTTSTGTTSTGTTSTGTTSTGTTSTGTTSTGTTSTGTTSTGTTSTGTTSTGTTSTGTTSTGTTSTGTTSTGTTSTGATHGDTVQLDLTPYLNVGSQVHGCGPIPTSFFHGGASRTVSFRFGTQSNWYWGPSSSAPLVLPVVPPRPATDVFTAANTFWGDTNPAHQARITFTGSAGASYTFHYLGNTNIRDYLQNIYTNTLTDTAVARNMFTCTNHRMDVQHIALPEAFRTQNLVQIRVDDPGVGGQSRIALAAITVIHDGDQISTGSTSTGTTSSGSTGTTSTSTGTTSTGTTSTGTTSTGTTSTGTTSTGTTSTGTTGTTSTGTTGTTSTGTTGTTSTGTTGTTSTGTTGTTSTGTTGTTSTGTTSTGSTGNPGCTPNPCEHGGTCLYGVCTCARGWLGPTCSEPAVAPRLEAMPNATVSEFASFVSATPVLTQGFPAPTFIAITKPPAATINPATGVVSWTSAEASEVPHTVRIRAVNDAGYGEATYFVTVPPSYNCSAFITGAGVYNLGSPVTIQGSCRDLAGASIGRAVPYVLRIYWRGSTRSFALTTRPTGTFIYDFRPSTSEAGLFAFGAYHPASTSTARQGQFNIVGFKVQPAFVTLTGFPGDLTFANFTNIINMGDLPITGLTASVLGLDAVVTAAGLTNVPADLAVGANEHLSLAATVISPWQKTIAFTFTCDQPGLVVNLQITLQIARRIASLRAAPASFDVNVVRGRQNYFQTVITNVGTAATGPLTVTMPTDPIFSLASAQYLPPLAIGASTPVQFFITPAANQSFAAISSSFVVNDLETGVLVPLRVGITSSEDGDFNLTVTDEFTFHAPGNPPVAGIYVRLTDTVTGATYTIDNATGTAYFPHVRQGNYLVQVQAIKHASAQFTAEIIGYGLSQTVFLRRDIVSYTWTVTPTTIVDEYKFTLRATFETHVPAPIIIVEPARISLDTVYKTDIPQVVFTITNKGFIAADDGELEVPEDMPCITLTKLLDPVGPIPANSTVIVPVLIDRDYACIDCYVYGVCDGTRRRSVDPNKQLALPARPQQKRAAINGYGFALSPCFAGIFKWTLQCGGTIDYQMIVSWTPSTPCGGGSSSGPGTGGGGVYIGGGGCFGCGGGPIVGGGTVYRTAYVLDQKCDPCANEIFQCLLGFIPLPCINPTTFIFPPDSVLGAVQWIAGCINPIAGIVVNALKCVIEIAQCRSENPGSKRSELALGDGLEYFDKRDAVTAARDYLRRNTDRMLNGAELSKLPFGEAFMEYVHGQAGSNFVAAFVPFASPSSENGEYLSPAERAALLAILPNGATVAAATVAFDRWDRTIEYWAAGIYTEADVPDGQSTDFVDHDEWLERTARYAQDSTEVLQEGYASMAEAYNAAFQLYDEELGRKEAGVCAKVVIEIDQDLVLTRQAFSAKLTIGNDASTVLENILVEITITAVADGSNANSRFTIGTPTLAGITGVDGLGTVAVQSSGTAVWLIVPNNDAAPMNDTLYRIGGRLLYKSDGVNLTNTLWPATVTVTPEPLLEVYYFLQQQVYSDDPFTAGFELADPFYLGLMIINSGYGVARQMSITSGQPKIVENEKGLLISFSIIGSHVGNTLSDGSLTVNFGNLPARSTGVADWIMISSLQGKFLEVEATYRHITPAGLPISSLVTNVSSFLLSHEVRIDHPSDDGLYDFLVNKNPDPWDLPDHVYSSAFATSPALVFALRNATTGPVDINADNATANFWFTPSTAGFQYVRIDDFVGFDAPLMVSRVRRSDGKILLPQNVWQTRRIQRYEDEPEQRLAQLHVFDYGTTGGYEVTYRRPARVSGLQTSAVTKTSVSLRWTAPQLSVYFVVSDQSEPVALNPRLLSSVYTIGNLLPDTEYTFGVAAAYPGPFISEPQWITVRTQSNVSTTAIFTTSSGTTGTTSTGTTGTTSTGTTGTTSTGTTGTTSTGTSGTTSTGTTSTTSTGTTSTGTTSTGTTSTGTTSTGTTSTGTTSTGTTSTGTTSTGTTSTGTTGTTRAAATVTVVATGANLWNPAHVTVNVGDSVRWTWTGRPHNVRQTDSFDSCTATAGPMFDSGATASAGDYSFTFTTPGVYYYMCSVHCSVAGHMTGSVTVVGPTTGTTSTGTTSTGTTGTTSTGTTSTGTTGTTSTGTTSTGTTGTTSTGTTSTGTTGTTSTGTTSTGTTGTTSTGTTSTGTTGTTSTGTTSTGTTGTTSTGTTSTGTTGTSSTGTTSTGTSFAVPGSNAKYAHMVYQDSATSGWNTGYVSVANPGTPAFVHVPLRGDNSLKANDGITVHNALSPGQTSSALYVVGFTNPIPETATVTGVRLLLRRFASAAGARDSRLALVIGGQAVDASNRCAGASGCDWPVGSVVLQTHGGAGDMWGLSPSVLTPTVINANLAGGWTMDQGFGFSIIATNAAGAGTIELFLETAEFTVYYTTPLPPPPPPPPPVGTTASETPVPPSPPPASVSKAERFPQLQWQSAAGANGWNISWVSAAAVGYPALLSYAAAWAAPRDLTLREGNNLWAHASLDASATSTTLFVTSFSNLVPVDAVVTGIMVSLSRRSSVAGLQDAVVALVINGTIVEASNRCPSNFNCAPWQTTRVFNKIGGTTDKWNVPELLTASNLNDRRSGVAIATRNVAGSGQPVEAFLDGVTLNVYYTLASSAAALDDEGPVSGSLAARLLDGSPSMVTATVILAAVGVAVVAVLSVVVVRRRLAMKRLRSIAPAPAAESVVVPDAADSSPTASPRDSPTATRRVPTPLKAQRSPSYLDELELQERPADS